MFRPNGLLEKTHAPFLRHAGTTEYLDKKEEYGIHLDRGVTKPIPLLDDMFIQSLYSDLY